MNPCAEAGEGALGKAAPVDELLASYRFSIPRHLWAQRPASPRDHSRLLVYHCGTGEVVHTYFHQLAAHLPKHSHLIFNNSRVFACRLLGRKATGGRVEIFLLSPSAAARPGEEWGRFPALLRCSGAKRPGDRYLVEGVELELLAREGRQFWLGGKREEVYQLADRVGRMPIPPYIRQGLGDFADRRDYQTLYAQEVGSVAAPTAGLHFTPRVFYRLKQHSVACHFLTLHVGPGTFTPIETPRLGDHSMHCEQFVIPRATQEVIANNWGQLFCVGTTSLRAVESLADAEGHYSAPGPGGRETGLFIRPGSPLHSFKGLITNFHLPESSLFVLLCAVVGRERALELYRLAVERSYRFFSYGDAMVILR